MSSVQGYFAFIQVIDRRVSALCLEDVNMNSLPSKANSELLLTAVIKSISQRENVIQPIIYFNSLTLSINHARLSKLKSIESIFLQYHHSKANEINYMIRFLENFIHSFSLFLFLIN